MVLDQPDILVGHLPLLSGHLPGFKGIFSRVGSHDGSTFSRCPSHQVYRLLLPLVEDLGAAARNNKGSIDAESLPDQKRFYSQFRNAKNRNLSSRKCRVFSVSVSLVSFSSSHCECSDDIVRSHGEDLTETVILRNPTWWSKIRESPRGLHPTRFSSPRTYVDDVSSTLFKRWK